MMLVVAALVARVRWGLVCAFSMLGLWWAAEAAAQQPGGSVDPASAGPTAVVVRFEPGADPGDRAAARRAADVRYDESLPVARMEVVDPEPGVSVEESVAALERSPDVAYAEPDVPRRAFASSDDPYLDLEWALRNIGQTVGGTAGTPGADVDGDLAWDTTVGSRDVVVAVIDTGLDVEHPDLAPNLWANPGETGGGRDANGSDDDGDGLVDDRMGWDWVDGDNQPLDENGHGTHVSGTIAARGNDASGVSGVAWRASLMPLRVLDDTGSGRVSDVVKAYGYASRHGARVVNASLGGGSYSRAERDALAAAPGVLFVVAAGNDGADNDATASYPCNYGLDNVLCVAASDQADNLAAFSNFGATTVDVAAPGVNIASTWPGRRWALLDGTSMATPHVTGTAALALAANASLDVAGLRAALLSSADPRPALTGKVATGGRLDAAAAVAAATGTAPPAASATPSPQPESQPSPAPAPQPASPAAPAPSAPPASPARPARARDRVAPGLSVATAARTPLRRALSRGVRVAARCSERCTVRLRLVLDGRTARRLGLTTTGRPVVIARADGRLRAGTLTRRLRPGPDARRRLIRDRSVPLTIRAEARDPAGNRRARSVRTTLRAP